MLNGLIFMLFLAGIYGICYLIALPIAKRRKLWARRMIIGKDSEERQEELRNIARDIILEKKIPDELEDVEVTISKERNKIAYVSMKTKKTILTLKPGGETIITNKGFSEKGAVAVVALPFMGIALTILIVVMMLFLV